MELRRFFVDKSDITGDTVTVRGDEFLHMTKVLRLKLGFKAIICANDGIEILAIIKEISKDYATLNIESRAVADKRHKSLTLYAGVLKNNKLDFVIQKAVELGVDRIVPFVSANSAETKFNLERAQKIALESAKQCGTAYLTEVGESVPFEKVLLDAPNFDTMLCAYEFDRKNRIRDAKISGNKVSLIVGSEGGFQQNEIAKARDAGIRTVTLGRRILRAETAGIVAAALTLDTLGELDYD